MSSDAEIVRCAAPWPGAAASLLEGFAALGPGTWSLGQICGAAASGIDAGIATQVLAGLAVAGLCAPTIDPEDCWLCDREPAELVRLAQLLSGAEHFRRMRLSPSVIELAVTMPMAPSYLERELPPLAGRPGGYLSTNAAFHRLAEVAVRRLVVMSPFIDPAGFRWLRRIFEATRQGTDRVLILRNCSQYTVELGVQHADWLRALEISVFDYHLSHQSNAGRPVPIETFHAKVVVADDALAYVGSANLLNSSEGVSLEAGVLVEGGAATQVSRLVDSILRVARAL